MSARVRSWPTGCRSLCAPSWAVLAGRDASCNPKVARVVLGAEPKLSAIMPCSWSVYELTDGTVWVSHMNIGMMSKMMGGVVGKAMGGVAEVDERFLEQVLR